MSFHIASAHQIRAIRRMVDEWGRASQDEANEVLVRTDQGVSGQSHDGLTPHFAPLESRSCDGERRANTISPLRAMAKSPLAIREASLVVSSKLIQEQ